MSRREEETGHELQRVPGGIAGREDAGFPIGPGSLRV